MRHHLLGAAAAAVLALAGCTSQLGHTTLLTAESIDGIPDPVAHDVRGEHCQIQWTMDLQPRLQKAMQRALRSAGEGNALANTSIYYTRQTWILFNRNCLSVEGDVVEIERVEGLDGGRSATR